MRLAFIRLCHTAIVILATVPAMSGTRHAEKHGGKRGVHSSSGSPYPPSFLPTPLNVTALTGQLAVLQCAIENRGTRTVVWRRASEPNPLTIGEHTFVGDKRFYVRHKTHSLEWNLHIRDAKTSDTGIYECHVTTKARDIRQLVFLHVDEMKYVPVISKTGGRNKQLPIPKPGIQITGSNYVEKGNTLTLTCNATGYDYPPDDLDWFKDGFKISDSWRQQISKHVSLSGKTIVSTLKVSRAIMMDAGTYVCRASDMQITSVKINVLNTTSTNEKRAYPNNQSTVGLHGPLSCVSPVTASLTSLLSSLLACALTSCGF